MFVFAATAALIAIADMPPLLVMPGVDAGVVMVPADPDTRVLFASNPPVGTSYRRVDLGGIGETVTVSGDAEDGSVGCGDDTAIRVPFESLPSSDASYVLVPGAWKAAPSPIGREAASEAKHGAMLAALLAANNLSGARITGGEAVTADLDGDGRAELVLSATNVDPAATESRAGDFAALVVQRSAGGKPEMVTLSFGSVGPDSGNAVDNIPVVDKLVAIADLDGDGRMEIIVEGMGYEHSYVDAWSLPAEGTPAGSFAYSCAP